MISIQTKAFTAILCVICIRNNMQNLMSIVFINPLTTGLASQGQRQASLLHLYISILSNVQYGSTPPLKSLTLSRGYLVVLQSTGGIPVLSLHEMFCIVMFVHECQSFIFFNNTCVNNVSFRKRNSHLIYYFFSVPIWKQFFNSSV